jgi:hypothetical protein
LELNQALVFEPREVSACGGRAHLGERGKLGAGAGAAIDQAIEHAGAGWLSDGRGDAGDDHVCVAICCMALCRHSSMLDEVCLHDKHILVRHDCGKLRRSVNALFSDAC